ncbi:MAG: zinc ribbon domain-containing protein [Deltaproteobacteria bacterium]|nr:zinc ribbon domain-containing protein [Deltaproteobacteria bacterium]
MAFEKLIEQLGQQSGEKLIPLVERYNSFKGKILSRVDEIKDEVNQGIGELIDNYPYDYGAVSAGFSAVKGRFSALSTKVENGVEKLEQEWEDIQDNLKVKSSENSIIYKLWWKLYDDSRNVMDNIEKMSETLEIRNGGKWADILRKKMLEEKDIPVNCPQCGGALETKIRYQNLNETCPHCGSLNEIKPTLASAAWFNAGIINHARNMTIDGYFRMKKAEDDFHKFRFPALRDQKNRNAIIRQYWKDYYTVLNDEHPAPVRTVEEHTDAKLVHYESNVWDDGAEKRELEDVEKLLQLAAIRDIQVLNHISSSDHFDFDEAIHAAFEHDEGAAVDFLLSLKWKKKTKEDVLSPDGSFSKGTEFAKWREKRLAKLRKEINN